MTPDDRTARLVEIVESTLARVGSVGLIVPDALLPSLVDRLTGAGIGHAVLGDEPTDPDDASAEFDVHLDVVPASLAKGLEFDHVVLVEPAGIVAGEPDRTPGSGASTSA